MKDVGTTNTAGSSAVTAGDQRPSTTLEILVGARELISDPDKWVDHCPDNDEHHCSVTAIFRASKGSGASEAEAWLSLRYVQRFTGNQSLVVFNDSHIHAEVLAAFDKAISALKSPVGNPER